MNQDLNGFSGAKLAFVSVDSVVRIRKSAASLKEGDRLRKQALKQMAYGKYELNIQTPQILAEGDRAGVYYFDMQFVSGMDGHRYLEQCSSAKLKCFLSILSDHLVKTHALPTLVDSAYDTWFDAAINKLLEIHEKAPCMDSSLFGRLIAGAGNLRKFSGMQKAFCHGDMTLENILVDHLGKLWLVDMLDSPFEHPWQDYVKLFQDLSGGWFEIKGRRIGPAYQSYLADGLSEVIKTVEPDYFSVHNVLMALNFSRILPYVKNEFEKNFVLQRINYYTALIS
jgi:hypothetical protein